MGIEDGCDDGKQLWMKDVETEGGLKNNTQCTPWEMEQLQSASPANAIFWCEKNKEKLKAGQHGCMDVTINYKRNTIPVSGKHRPVWPVYGEYSYLPPQRWIHNLEHGAIVLLYHPCAADSSSLTRLRRIVSGCLRRHIITPSRRVSLQRPFALVSWGCYYNFARFKSDQIQNWIKNHAHKDHGVQQAPEAAVWADGDYNQLLIHKASTITDVQDSQVCPS